MKKVALLFFLFLCFHLASSQNWQALGSGADRFVYTMYVDSTNNELYIGGDFIHINGKKARGIAKWNGIQFDTLHKGMDIFTSSYPGQIQTITRYKSRLYAAGDFLTAGDFSAKYIATWDGIQWDSLPERFNNPVRQLLKHDTSLYVCGAFSKIGNNTYNSIARFDGSNWNIVGDNSIWNTGLIKCMAFYKNELYVGGSFYDGSKGIYRIAKWNGHDWVGLPGGIFGPLANIWDMKVYNDKLVVSGLFKKADGNTGNSIMQWDSLQWTDMGGGMASINPQVQAMCLNHEFLYASGIFNTAGGVPANGIARWDGMNWCGLGTVFDNSVSCIAFYNDSLYIGGGFWTISGDSMHSISKWIGGTYTDTCGHLSVGINEQANINQNFDLYPNPTTSTITIQFPQAIKETTSIEIKNMLGQTMKALQLQTDIQQQEINVSDLSNGLYFVQCQSKRTSISKKFVKQ